MLPQIGRIIVAEVLREIEDVIKEEIVLNVENKMMKIFPVS